MNKALLKYQFNSKTVKESGKLYDLIIDQYPLLQTQAEEILRTQVVMIVSAFDAFIHDITQIGIIEVYKGIRPQSHQCTKYPIGLNILTQIDQITDNTAKIGILETHIRNNNSKDSYQAPKSVEYALSLINITNLWTQLSSGMSMSANDIKNQLSLIVDRRNKIAHESDYNPTTGTKHPINKTMVTDVINYFDKLVSTIYNLL